MLSLHRIISTVGLVAFASMAPTSNAQLTYNGTCSSTISQLFFDGDANVQTLATQVKLLYPCKTVSVEIKGGGSTVGSGKVCAVPAAGAAVDIGGLIRDFLPSEWTPELAVAGQGQCKFLTANLRKIREIEVGNVALTVAVPFTGPARECVEVMGGLTLDQVRWIFSDSKTAPSTDIAPNFQNPARAGPANSRFWSDLNSDPKCQATEIALHGAQVGSVAQIRFSQLMELTAPALLDVARGVFTSRNTTVIGNEIAASANGIGFLPYHASHETSTSIYGVPIKLLKLDKTFLTVPPTSGMIRSRTYPLAIPLLMYVHFSTVVNASDPSVTTVAPRLAQARDFLQFGLTYSGNALTDNDIGYVSLNMQRRRAMLCRLEYTEYCASIAPTKAPTKAPVVASPSSLAPANPQVPASSPSTGAAPIAAPVKAPAPAPVKAPTPAPVKAPTPAPVKASTPSPVKASTLAPVKASTPAPVKAPTPAPVKPPTASTVKAPTPAPVKAATVPSPVSGLRPSTPTKPASAPAPAPQKPERPLLNNVFTPLLGLLSGLFCPPEFVQKFLGISC